ncbi:MAG: peptidylprolyl isomerase [Planctomycetota bacterium]|jgi:cyclophilin family peptidyl-prolyl cis-trans isomerase
MVRTTIKNKGKGKGKGSEPLAASKDDSRDMVSRAGIGAGSELVNTASRFMASYGRVIVPVVFLGLAALAAFWAWSRISQSSDTEARNAIDAAAAKGVEDKDLAKLRTSMEETLVDFEDDETLTEYGYYRWSLAAYGLLEPPYTADDAAKVIVVMKDFEGSATEGDESSRMHDRIKKLRERLEADKTFLDSDKAKATLPWTHNSKFTTPEVKLTGDTEDPIVVIVTSAGTMRFQLYEDDAPNAVKHFVDLCKEGFYNRTDFTAESYANHDVAPNDLFRNATVIAAGKEGRPAGIELDKPDNAEDGEDVDTVVVENPYTIEYEGASKRFFPGSIGLLLDPDEPTRARSEFFVVIKPSDALADNLKPLGILLDIEKSMEVARRLHEAEIYYSYVEQQRKDVEYKPEVFYDGWPVPTVKQDEVPDAISFMKVETEVVAADSKLNPIVVIETAKGDILIELYEDMVPNTVANFINLVEEGFFDKECEFYRVEGTGVELRDIYKGTGARIIQGGFDQGESRADYDYGLRNEAVDNEKKYFARNVRGTVAMARTSQLHSASTEFFVNLKNYPDWDKKDSPYCVFGNVIYGLDVAAKIEADDEIKGAKVLRKRDHEYVPEVKYKSGGGYVKKKAVELDNDETDE